MPAEPPSIGTLRTRSRDAGDITDTNGSSSFSEYSLQPHGTLEVIRGPWDPESKEPRTEPLDTSSTAITPLWSQLAYSRPSAPNASPCGARYGDTSSVPTC